MRNLYLTRDTREASDAFASNLCELCNRRENDQATSADFSALLEAGYRAGVPTKYLKPCHDMVGWIQQDERAAKKYRDSGWQGKIEYAAGTIQQYLR